jgi:predicted transcriptional regulator
MKTKMLERALERMEQWPARLQDEFAQIALDMDTSVVEGVYVASEQELAAIDEGLRAADEGRFATDQEVEVTFAKFRQG